MFKPTRSDVHVFAYLWEKCSLINSLPCILQAEMLMTPHCPGPQPHGRIKRDAHYAGRLDHPKLSAGRPGEGPNSGRSGERWAGPGKGCPGKVREGRWDQMGEGRQICFKVNGPKLQGTLVF